MNFVSELQRECASCGAGFVIGHPGQRYCAKDCGGTRHQRFLARNGVDYMRNAKMKSIYGIGIDDYNAMLNRQGGVCAICDQPPQGVRPLMVDHDHATGTVRGLLCVNCNRNLAVVESDLLPRFMAYLARAERQGFDACANAEASA